MKKIVLVAGGTGGHINAALSIGDKILFQNKFGVLFISGMRPLDYKLFKGRETLHLNVQGLGSKNPIYVLKTIIKNLIAFLRIFFLFFKNRPVAIIGAGGYVCGPVLVAGFILKVPLFILEQNSRAGLTNRLLSYIADKIFLHFFNTQGFPEIAKSKLVVTGNPIRKEFYEEFKTSLKSEEKSDYFNLLIFGGSLGASSINNMLKNFLEANLDISNLKIKHQVGSESKNLDIKGNESKNIKYEAYPYFDHIIDEYNWSNLLICRSGASTLSELRIIRKPVILIPYPYATHNHQWHNAKLFQQEVNFPVYVHSVEELAENNFELLLKIILEEKNRLIEPLHNGKRAEIEVKLPEEIILNEVSQYV